MKAWAILHFTKLDHFLYPKDTQEAAHTITLERTPTMEDEEDDLYGDATVPNGNADGHATNGFGVTFKQDEDDGDAAMDEDDEDEDEDESDSVCLGCGR